MTNINIEKIKEDIKKAYPQYEGKIQEISFHPNGQIVVVFVVEGSKGKAGRPKSELSLWREELKSIKNDLAKYINEHGGAVIIADEEMFYMLRTRKVKGGAFAVDITTAPNIEKKPIGDSALIEKVKKLQELENKIKTNTKHRKRKTKKTDDWVEGDKTPSTYVPSKFYFIRLM